MLSAFSHLLADITTLPWVAIIAVGGGILLTIIVIVGGLIVAYHRQKQWHETARLALEKGQPLPLHGDSGVSEETIREALHHDRDQRRGPARDLRAGLICVGTGAGLFVFFDALLGRWMAYVGAIPGFIGVALILFGLLSLLFDRRDQSSTPRPPPS